MGRSIARLLIVTVGCVLPVAATVVAQSPNTAAVTVVVEDQSGAVVPDATVAVINARPAPSAARRRAVTGWPP